MATEPEDSASGAKTKPARTAAVAPPTELQTAESLAACTAEAEAVAAEALAIQAEVDALAAEAGEAHAKSAAD